MKLNGCLYFAKLDLFDSRLLVGVGSDPSHFLTYHGLYQ